MVTLRGGIFRHSPDCKRPIGICDPSRLKFESQKEALEGIPKGSVILPRWIRSAGLPLITLVTVTLTIRFQHGSVLIDRTLIAGLGKWVGRGRTLQASHCWWFLRLHSTTPIYWAFCRPKHGHVSGQQRLVCEPQRA